MTDKLLALDLEIATPFPSDGDWHHKGLGISIAAACHRVNGDFIYEMWLPPRIDLGERDYKWDKRIPPQIVAKMCQYLQSMVMKGYRLVTWNGLGFDLPFIREHLGGRPLWRSIAKLLAMRSYDACFQLICERGFAVGLESVCQGFGLEAKLEGMHGELAPELWSGTYNVERREQLHAQTGFWAGTAEAQRRVLEYVQRDAKMTYQVYEQIAAHDGQIRWINYRGGKSHHAFQKRESQEWPLAQVRDCLTMPTPDTEWMAPELKERFEKGKFTGWLAEED